MSQNISLQELIALNNTPKAKALIVRYGYRPARSFNDLIHKLFQFTKEYKEEALKELAEIHPHKDLILNYAQIIPVVEEKKSNCNGDDMCSVCKAKQTMMSFEGTNTNTNLTQGTDIKSLLPIIAMTSIVTAVFVAVLKR
jgi:ubiquitin